MNATLRGFAALLQGGISSALLGVNGSPGDVWSFAVLPGKLPAGLVYELGPLANPNNDGAMAERALLGWILGTH